MSGVPAAEDVFRAIADPTRRAILDRLASGPQSVTALLEPLDMTQPAISQHLRVLRDVGLVRPTRAGRFRLYALQPAPLRDVAKWIDLYRQFWTDKLGKLGKYLDESK
ncbi:MAG TPA: metalloregulator ArsR/SmtB family transcription factor [Planctomycetota bacterium]|nr:metalloregulator ArsR/SmtB family transcription factor [Planctomycetota bacterium]